MGRLGGMKNEHRTVKNALAAAIITSASVP